jgi:hypothetical protein
MTLRDIRQRAHLNVDLFDAGTRGVLAEAGEQIVGQVV